MRSRICLTLSACLLFADVMPTRAASIGQPADGKAIYQAIAKREAEQAGLPGDIADAVMAIESGYDPSRIGGVGEIGLMQIRPSTASMLGFRGSDTELAKPDVNIHLGVAYLAEAWRRANGDLCRALMKYRAGHGEEVMTPLSSTYCARAKAHLAAADSPLAKGMVMAQTTGETMPPIGVSTGAVKRAGRLRGAAFWAVHNARVRVISARIERRWRLMAAR